MDGMAFTGTAGSGHIVWMDGAADVGGQNGGFRPTEMVLMGSGWLHRGRNLNPELVKKAVMLSWQKYCSVSAVLSQAA